MIIRPEKRLNDVETLQLRCGLLEAYIDDLERYIRDNVLLRMCKLEVYDKDTDSKHIVGTNRHDVLYVKDGVVKYYNLQNGEGTGKHGSYSFVEKDIYGEPGEGE